MRSLTLASLILLANLFFMLSPSTGQAEIESVVVFPDRASITRFVETRVDPGAGVLQIDNLPATLLRNSLRISATGPDGLMLGSFEFSTRRGVDQVNPRARELSERIQALKDQQAEIDASLRARQLQLTLLESFASGSNSEEPLSPQDWAEALRWIGDGADGVLNRQRELGLEKRELSEQIQRLERELADLGNQQRDTSVLDLNYTAQTGGNAAFIIEYVVPQAYWRPVYEWRLDTQSARLEMVQSAIVQQNTGEDWSNVELSVSLARPSAGGQLPELRPWWIGVAPPPAASPRATLTEEAMLDRVRMTGAKMQEAEIAQADLAGTEFTQSYRIGGRSSVRSDNQQQRFGLASHSMDVRLTARSVPTRQTQAWLFVEGTFNGEAALPPGALTLYQDNTLVGQNYFAGIRPGAELATSFGVDDRIEIEYELQEQTQDSEGVIRRFTQQTREYQIKVHNRHNRSIELTLLDQMPVSTDERIEVELTRNTTPPDQRDVNDQPGILAWNIDLDAGQQREVIIGYTVRYPEDIEYLSGW